jgi:hypothetical protein
MDDPPPAKQQGAFLRLPVTFVNVGAAIAGRV